MWPTVGLIEGDEEYGADCWTSDGEWLRSGASDRREDLVDIPQTKFVNVYPAVAIHDSKEEAARFGEMGRLRPIACLEFKVGDGL